MYKFGLQSLLRIIKCYVSEIRYLNSALQILLLGHNRIISLALMFVIIFSIFNIIKLIFSIFR